jgi:hypothetical protein
MMQVLSVIQAGGDFRHKWPDSSIEIFHTWIEYKVMSEDGPHQVKIALGTRKVYGAERVRVLITIDGYPQAEFFGADDYAASGQVLSEIKIHAEVGERICRYPEDPLPERYTLFNVVGLPIRVQAKGVHNAWAVVANISDHKTMIALAALRKAERTEKA